MSYLIVAVSINIKWGGASPPVKMRYTIPTYIALVFVCQQAIATNYSSSVNPSGAWTTNSNWSPSSGHPDDSGDNATLTQNDSIYLTASVNYTINTLTFNQNTALYIGPNATLTVAKIEIKKDSRLYVDGTLTCTGNLDMDKDSSLDIETSGTMQVDGSVDAKSGVALTVDGSMDVTGDFTMATGGTISGTGTIDVSGTVDIPAGADPESVIDSGPLPVVLSRFELVAGEDGVPGFMGDFH